MSIYSQKLTHPKWQKRRLEILQKADWKCVCCGQADQQLEIHHLQYGEGEPWDVPDSFLECLCHDCHEFRTIWDDYWGKSSKPTRDCDLLHWFLSKAICPDGDYHQHFLKNYIRPVDLMITIHRLIRQKIADERQKSDSTTIDFQI
jgi:hypothetical protein